MRKIPKYNLEQLKEFFVLQFNALEGGEPFKSLSVDRHWVPFLESFRIGGYITKEEEEKWTYEYWPDDVPREKPSEPEVIPEGMSDIISTLVKTSKSTKNSKTTKIHTPIEGTPKGIKDQQEIVPEKVKPKKRGRPKKDTVEKTEPPIQVDKPKKRGRPKKVQTEN